MHHAWSISSSMLPIINLSGGSREALKWLALITMVIDHITHHLVEINIRGVWTIGRLAFPLFAVILAYNLAQLALSNNSENKQQTIIWRLLLTGLIAQPITMWVRDEFVLNVMFTLAAGAWLAYPTITRRPTLEALCAIAFAVLVGAYCEFAIYGIFFVFACAKFFEQQSAARAALALAALASLYFANGSNRALFALIPFVLAIVVDFKVPRVKWLFYAFYPVHFFVIGLLKYFHAF